MRITHFGLVALCAALLAAIPEQAEAQVAAGVPGRSTARVIVKFKADSPLLRRQALSATTEQVSRAQVLGARLGLELGAGAAVSSRAQVVFATGITSTELAQRLARENDVEYAVPDQRRRRFAAPNDPLYATGPIGNGPAVGQWYLRAPSGEVQSPIDAETAWNYTIGSSSIVVAVLDTGVRFDHPDLLRVAAGGNLLPGYDMVRDVDVANDGDGRDPDPSDPGDWLTLAEVSEPGGFFEGCSFGAEDSSWHGTQTSGLIGALTNNGIGMASVGRNVRVLPVRVLGKCGGFDSDIQAGMLWAAGLDVPGVPANPSPARVINLSLGEVGECLASYQDVVAQVNAMGVVIVASAGNSAGHAVGAPANCDGILAVAALRHVGTKVGFSDLGPEIALSAPGGNCVNITPGSACLYPILTTSNSGTTTPALPIYTDSFNPSLGTSFSAPLVSATAALMLSVQPSLTPTQVKLLLQGAARRFPTTGGDNGDGTPVLQCMAPQYDGEGNPIDQLQCYCTTNTCGAGMLDAGAAVRAALPAIVGTASIVANPYGAISVQGATLNGSTISNLQSNVVIQLGNTAGSADSYAEIDFQGLNVAAGNTLTVRSGALGQTVRLVDVGATANSIAGNLQVQGGNGAAAPGLYVRNPKGITVDPGGSINTPSGLTVDTLGSDSTTGQPLVNNGVLDGGSNLQLFGAKVTGSGSFKGNAVVVSTFGNANNPANGASYLSNGLQIYPSNGNTVQLTLNPYSFLEPQVVNVQVFGNASVWMPSAWPAGSSLLGNSRPVIGGTRSPQPGYNGGSLIVQASGTLTLSNGGTNDFVFPGAIVLKSGSTLDVNGVSVINGWTGAGAAFQGVFFESPSIGSSSGNIQVFTNNLNWVNFSSLPHAPVRTWQLVSGQFLSLTYQTADSVAPHLNTYSILVEAAATGQCWVCLVNTSPVNLQ